MRYLSGTSGSGILKCAGTDIVRAAYDFDTFERKSGEITRCGEIRLPAAYLAGVFGRPDVELLTDDGELLHLKFSERKLAPASDAAHVDVVPPRQADAPH